MTATSQTARFQNYVAGEWVDSDEFRPNVNPSNLGDVIGEYARADAATAQRAIEAAAAAFSGWATSGIQQRADILDKAGSAILARKEELGRLLSREEGKTLAEGIGEAARAGHIFKYFAGEVLRTPGEKLPSVRPGIDVEITREPVGVVGIITPWNFPIAIPAWKIAPALAYGNCVVFKPADLVPGCGWALAEILHEAGIPKGVFNLLMGRGSVVGQAMVESKRVQAISFTGSVDTGRAVAVQCVQSGKKVQLEMGGKNPLVVLDDADLKVAVNCAIQGAFYSTGQRCTASSRLVVTQGIHDAFVAAMREAMQALVVGDAVQQGTQIGPVVDATQLEQDLRYTKLAAEEGAEVVGGETVKGATEGYFLRPALFLGTTNQMRINREEIFGPSASIIRVKDYDEALAVANDTDFGLCAGVCTTSLKYASHFKRHAEAGMVMVNLPTAGVDYHVPFGGRKGSSYGPREQGSYAAEFYTTVKTAYIAP
jgi:alpha-ketoglutaric semialdehyde dehydrogenase